MKLLTVEQVATSLHVSRACVYSLIQTGKLACVRIGIGRGVIRIHEDDLANFIEGCRSAPTRRNKKSVRGGQFVHLDRDRLSEAWQDRVSPTD